MQQFEMPKPTDKHAKLKALAEAASQLRNS